jgi:hypothetical protein
MSFSADKLSRFLCEMPVKVLGGERVWQQEDLKADRQTHAADKAVVVKVSRGNK